MHQTSANTVSLGMIQQLVSVFLPTAIGGFGLSYFDRICYVVAISHLIYTSYRSLKVGQNTQVYTLSLKLFI